MKNRTKKIVLASLFTAVIAVVSQLFLPTPFGIPLTLQTFGVCLCGFLFGQKWGVASVAVYIIAGAVGLPVFSGFQGGIGHIIDPTGGFILGFLPLAFFCGIKIEKNKGILNIIFAFLGLIICHILGIIQFAFITETHVLTAFISISLPFILKDAIFLVLAFFIAKNTRKIIFR